MEPGCTPAALGACIVRLELSAPPVRCLVPRNARVCAWPVHTAQLLGLQPALYAVLVRQGPIQSQLGPVSARFVQLEPLGLSLRLRNARFAPKVSTQEPVALAPAFQQPARLVPTALVWVLPRSRAPHAGQAPTGPSQPPCLGRPLVGCRQQTHLDIGQKVGPKITRTVGTFVWQ